ncbi:hypothetical protein [Mameliella alba]|uniref:hypothetical protein n=1 Tax=Mameliella alba TaxID=561184 RepID=UPI000B535366|nr:hypothetical protein [Mameliella alba]OWV39432.1 hypothetical protein CDZ95_26255 [Mameliella alba]
MLTIMRQIKALIQFAMHAEWVISLGGMMGLGGVIGSFGVSAWAASTSDWVASFGSLGWVSAGFLGALTFALIYLAYAASRLYISRAMLIAKRAEETTNINPLEDTFQREIITVSDIYSPYHQQLENKHFRECRFVGPMVIVFGNDMTIRSPSMNECNFVVVNPGYVNGVIQFSKSTFIDCEFDSVTFLVQPELARIIEESLKTGAVQFLGAPYK